MEDDAIVGLYLERDEAALSQTKEKFGWRLRNLALGILKDAEIAEECENDVYLRAWNSIPPHAPYGYLFQYLAKLTRDTAFSRLRGRTALKRRALIRELTDELQEAAPGNPEDFIDDNALREMLNAFLEELPEEMRNVFIRRYWYMDPVNRIAEGYGMSVSKVKSILFRCRNRLKQYLERNGYEI